MVVYIYSQFGKKGVGEREAWTHSNVLFDLVHENCFFRRAKMDLLALDKEINVLERRVRLFVFWLNKAPNGRSLEIVRFVNVLVRREHITHDHKADFAAARELDTVETKYAGDKGLWVCFDVLEDSNGIAIKGANFKIECSPHNSL